MIDQGILTQAIGDLNEGKIDAMLDEFIADGPSQEDAQDFVDALQQGMEIVGGKFESGDYFVGDLLYSGAILTKSIEALKPYLGSATDGQARGKIVVGTVRGDIHDIGKNIFKGLAEAGGFQVIDIGIDQPPEAFVDATKSNAAEIVGLSGVLTLSIDSMKKTIEAFRSAGIRDSVKIIIGGAAVNAGTGTLVGADEWSNNAASAVKTCADWVS
jgi:methanogenic corrinoid protein MtbC1